MPGGKGHDGQLYHGQLAERKLPTVRFFLLFIFPFFDIEYLFLRFSFYIIIRLQRNTVNPVTNKPQKSDRINDVFVLRTFAPIVSAHPYCVRKFTPRYA